MKRFFSVSVFTAFTTLSRLGALAALAVLLAPAQGEAAPEGGDFGLGIIAGEPSGLSGKLWLGPDNSLDFIAGFSVTEDWISLNADYVWHEWDLIPVNSGRLPLYYGMGVWTSVSSDPAVGGRGVIGLEYLFAKAPLDIFLEFGPGVQVLPRTDIAISAGLGMRFFF